MKANFYHLFSLLLGLLFSFQLAGQGNGSLILTGISEGPTNGAKLTEFYALKDITDLSIYGVGSANNGGGSDSVEYSFPAVTISAGTTFYLARDSAEFYDFYGFNADFIEDLDDPIANTFNGDDAYEVFENGEVIDVFGEIDADGTDQPWEYTDGWAKRKNGTHPDGSSFAVDNWSYSGLDVFDGTTMNIESTNPFPLGGFSSTPAPTYSLILVGLSEGPTNGAKLTEFYAVNDIPDLSIFGVGSANNGGGTDSVEYTFPSISIAAGTSFFLARDSAEFHDFYGIDADFIEDDVDPIANTFNGDDAYELFENGVVIDVFGEIDVDGTDQPWEHTDGWAKRKNGTGPDGSAFVVGNWNFSGLDVFDGTTSNNDASLPYPLDPYNPAVSLTNSLILVGLAIGPNNGSKLTEFYAVDDIPDLSNFSVGSANNGGGTDGIEYTFPAVFMSAGTSFFLARDSAEFHDFYGIDADFLEDDVDPTANTFNGDDAYELFENGVVIDVFGEIDVDGTGAAWEHTGGWAHRLNATGPDGNSFILDNWEISSLDALNGVLSNNESTQPYPLGSFTLDPCFGSSPIVITEIMYNPPGTDHQYVEFYNVSGNSINMSGYTLDGVNFTFPEFMLEPEAFVVVSSDSVRIESYFGISSFQWESGSLSDSGEQISLLDANGAVVDCVNYSTDAPWPTMAGGSGSSIVLCDFQAENNLGSNWQSASSGTNIVVDGSEIFANPGESATCSSDPLISLGRVNLTLGESSDSVDVTVYLEHPANTETMVTLQISSEGSAENGVDFTFKDTTLVFPASIAGSQTVKFALLDDTAEELSETFTVEIVNASNNAITLSGALKVRIIDNDSPVRDDLIMIGVIVGPSTPLKSTEFYAVNEIPDLSIYGIGSANNGGGTDGIEYRFPAVSVDKGKCFYVTRDSIEFKRFFGFPAQFEDNGNTLANTMNGDDAFELFQNEKVVDVFGEIDVDGTGTDWEISAGWAHRIDNTGPDGSTFVLANWEYSGLDAYASDNVFNEDADNPYPVEQCFAIISGTKDIATEFEWKVYPNPASTQLTIESEFELQEITLSTIMGKSIKKIRNPSMLETIDISNLNSEVYILTMISNNKIQSKKIIVQR